MALGLASCVFSCISLQYSDNTFYRFGIVFGCLVAENPEQHGVDHTGVYLSPTAKSSDVIGSVVKGHRSQSSATVLTFPLLAEDGSYSSTLMPDFQAGGRGRTQNTLVCMHQRGTPHFSVVFPETPPQQFLLSLMGQDHIRWPGRQ